MSALAEIKRAAAGLSPKDKEHLILFVGAQLRADGARLTKPRRFSPEQIQSWIAEDEADMRRFRG